MAILEIKTVPAEVLRLKAKPVKSVGNEINTQIINMIETMKNAPGAGLAAPQVGVSNRVIVVQFGDEEDEEIPPKTYAVVNPVITKPSKETVFGIEGCLSIPNIVGEVERSESIIIKGLNRYGQPFKLHASGWLARIFQHEVDHLEGILFTDRAASLTMIEDENPEEIEALQITIPKGLD
ncbi:MAG: peptide deformylase [Anaerolineaceae bacterium]|nr:peptide deformylase [Anaerolineaceae bacterium]